MDPDPTLPLDGNDALVENEPEGDTAREAPLEETPDASFTEEDEGDAVDNELVPVDALLEDSPLLLSPLIIRLRAGHFCRG